MQISYIGMKTEEVSIKPRLKVTMKIDSEMLQEVVVTGMQRMDKRLFTGATSKPAISGYRQVPFHPPA